MEIILSGLYLIFEIQLYKSLFQVWVGRLIKLQLLNKKFNINFKNSGFFINNRNKNYVCSLHPKKNFQWLYSSPIRYIDAILFGEIPLTTDKFIDNYHNLLSIKLNSKDQYQFKYNINKYSLDIKNINNKISNFNKYIKKDDFNGKIKLKQIIQNVKKNI